MERKQKLIRESLYILFRIESLASLDNAVVNKMMDHVEDVNRGIFFMVSGVFLSFCKFRP